MKYLKYYNEKTKHFHDTIEQYNAEIAELEDEEKKQAELLKQKDLRKAELLKEKECRKAEIKTLLSNKTEINSKLISLISKYNEDYNEYYEIESPIEDVAFINILNRQSRIFDSFFNKILK